MIYDEITSGSRTRRTLSGAARVLFALKLDGPLIVALALVAVFGLVVLYSASGQSAMTIYRTLGRLALGTIAMLVLAQVNPNFLRRTSPWLYAAGVLLLLIVYAMGHIGKGAQRWLDLGIVRASDIRGSLRSRALGAIDRYPDWVALFVKELAERPAGEVVGAWVPRLVPGAIAAFKSLLDMMDVIFQEFYMRASAGDAYTQWSEPVFGGTVVPNFKAFDSHVTLIVDRQHSASGARSEVCSVQNRRLSWVAFESNEAIACVAGHVDAHELFVNSTVHKDHAAGRHSIGRMLN